MSFTKPPPLENLLMSLILIGYLESYVDIGFPGIGLISLVFCIPPFGLLYGLLIYLEWAAVIDDWWFVITFYFFCEIGWWIFIKASQDIFIASSNDMPSNYWVPRDADFFRFSLI